METVRKSKRTKTKKENKTRSTTSVVKQTPKAKVMKDENKKNRTVSKNLLEVFDDANDKMKNFSLKKYFYQLMESGNKGQNDNSGFGMNSKGALSPVGEEFTPVESSNFTLQKTVSPIFTLTPEDFMNEIYNKINFYKQQLNFKQELNNIYIAEVQRFIDHFINIFNQASLPFEELRLLKNSFERTENIVKTNMGLLSEETNEKKIHFVNAIKTFFQCFREKLGSPNGKLDLPINLRETLSKMENIMEIVQVSRVERENYLLEKLKKMDDSAEKDVSEDTGKIGLLSNKKIKQTNERCDLLLDTAYLKKSKTRYGEDDEVIVEDNIIPQNVNENYDKIIRKSKKLFLRNFLQIYLIKDDGIFSESFFSKIDKSLLNSYKNFKFYEINFYFSVEESFQEFASYLQYIRKLFTRYVIVYKEKKQNKFVKITVCGVGKRQTLMKRHLINFMSGQVKHDCLFKISLFSNVFDSMSQSLRKVSRNKDYYFYSNFSTEVLNKIISKSHFI